MEKCQNTAIIYRATGTAKIKDRETHDIRVEKIKFSRTGETQGEGEETTKT